MSGRTPYEMLIVFLLKILFSADPEGKCLSTRLRNLAPRLVDTALLKGELNQITVLDLHFLRWLT